MTAHDELIVDTSDLEAVTGALKDLGAWGGDWEVSEDLGLALLRNLKVRSVAELDALIANLDAKLLSSTGSVPVLGKNDAAVIGYPQHKSVLDPIPLDGAAPAPDLTAGNGLHIGVVDTPLFRHPTFSGGGEVVADEEITPEDREVLPVWAGHATFVVGKIREHAGGARITVKAGLDGASGTRSLWETSRAIASFRGTDIKILNLSLGVATGDPAAPLALRRALDRLEPGVVIVAAAGNRGWQQPPPENIWPAAIPEVIAVGARPSGQGELEFTMKRSWVDYLADGFEVTGAYVRGKVNIVESGQSMFEETALWSGTSFAAATVTGALAASLAAGATLEEAKTALLTAVAIKADYPR